MKKTLLATSALALIAATAGAVDVEMYGQVNKAVMGYNDGQGTDVVIVDNEYSTTRAGLKGAQALDNGLTASALFEFDASDNNSQNFVQNSANGSTGTQTTPTNSNASFNQRQARVGLSGNFGGVYVGKQSVATDGVLGADLAGAQDVMGQDVASIGGGLKFRTTAPGSPFYVSAVSATANAMTTAFGDERANSVRYDSPIFAGFQGRASVQQGGDLDLSAFYDGAMGDFKIAGAAGVQFNNDGTTTASNVVKSEYGASLSVAHSTGLAATVAYSTQELDLKASNAKEGETLYGKVGYAWDAFEVAADYGTSKNYRVRTGDDKLKAFGLAGQYNLGHGVSVAGLYRNFDAEITGANTDSIDLYGVNMRVKF